MARPSWNNYFLILAKLAATRSTCISRKVGAVIVRDKHVLSTGYNGAISGVTHCTTQDKCYYRSLSIQNSKDFCRAVHAEVNALASAAKLGISLEGSIVYCTLAPCANCLKAMITSGVKEVFFETYYDLGENEVNKFLSKYYYQHRKIIKVKQITIDDKTKSTATEFIVDTTSKRRKDHY